MIVQADIRDLRDKMKAAGLPLLHTDDHMVYGPANSSGGSDIDIDCFCNDNGPAVATLIADVVNNLPELLNLAQDGVAFRDGAVV